MQAGHFGQAVFDPAGLTDDYKRQAEVSILVFSEYVGQHAHSRCLHRCCLQPASGCMRVQLLMHYDALRNVYRDPHAALSFSTQFATTSCLFSFPSHVVCLFCSFIACCVIMTYCHSAGYLQ